MLLLVLVRPRGVLRTGVSEVLVPVLEDRFGVHSFGGLRPGLIFSELRLRRPWLRSLGALGAVLIQGLVLPVVVVLVCVRLQTLWVDYLVGHADLLGAAAVLEWAQAGGTEALLSGQARADSWTVSCPRYAETWAQHRRVCRLSRRHRGDLALRQHVLVRSVRHPRAWPAFVAHQLAVSADQRRNGDRGVLHLLL